jgi:hypothetical protein
MRMSYEEYSEQMVAKLLDQLIDAQADFADRHRQWVEYREVYGQYPRPPSSFEDAKALADYQQRKKQWERREGAVSDPLHGTSERYEAAAERVRDILPRDVPLTHTYGGTHPERAGRYRITREHGPDASHGLKLEKLDTSSIF